MEIRKKFFIFLMAALTFVCLVSCGSSSSDDDDPDDNDNPAKSVSSLAGDITTSMTLTADTVWEIDGLVVVTGGAVLTIEPGTTIIGKSGTGANTSYMIIDKDSQIIADGTEDNPIIFTSETAYNGGTEAPGQWGGLTLIGNAADVGVTPGNEQVDAYEVNSEFVPGNTDAADNSGILRYVEILNSGITMEQDKEINGLSMVGVGSGTVVDHVTVKRSDDDCIEIWGGTVNVSNAYVEYCTDDQFDIDDGYSGTVTNLTINQHTDGNAGIEMSGTTAATFIGLKLTQNYSDKEGAIYFKKDGIGGHFEDCVIIDNVDDGMTIYSTDDADEANISFTNVSITSPDSATNFTDDPEGGSAADIETVFDNGTGNSENSTQQQVSTLAGDITINTTLTADTVWELDGLVAVKDGAVLTIEAGTTIIGKSGTGANTSYLVIDKGSQIIADGTEAAPIIFTSETAYNGGAEAPGQWGGLTLIGNAADVGVAPGNEQVDAYEVNSAFVPGNTDAADNSGILRYVEILNSGITMEQDKEINGLSMVGVGSGTTVDHVTVKRSDDDCIEIWGGTVNVTNATVEYCTDDQFDIDDGYSGTVTNLTINQHTDGNAGIEMSGTTDATFVGLKLTQDYSDKEGAIYFKKDGIGGHFQDCVIIDNVDDGKTIYSTDDADEANISFSNVSITSPNVSTNFANDPDSATASAADIEFVFDNGTGNSETATKEISTLAGDITSDMTLTADKVWELDGLVAVKDSAVLTIEAGTTIIGKSGTGANTSYLVIDKDSQIIADGTESSPIIFTSETAYNGGAEAPGQWGGLTLIGNAADVGVAPGSEQVDAYEVNSEFVPGNTDAADNSGILRYVEILNSGITMEQDKEINGLSMVGVGSGTVVDHVTVKRSDDDCIEIWGGTVNVTDATVEYCTDDQFDIDDGYSGTVTNLTINQHTDGNAGIEMSGSTAATFIGLRLTQDYSDKEGAIYFKKDGIGGHFEDCVIIDNVDDDMTIYSTDDADEDNITFTNVSITSPDSSTNFANDPDSATASAADIEAKFDAGTGNTEQ